jgi:hypothetical protein
MWLRFQVGGLDLRDAEGIFKARGTPAITQGRMRGESGRDRFGSARWVMYVVVDANFRVFVRASQP